ncbi:MAG: aspartate aminotransferase family protein [Nonlabens sp.]
MSREDFFRYQAPTTPFASGLEVKSAKGSIIIDSNDKAYLDMVAGVSALPLGHCHLKVVDAITKQIQSYLHVMVYGEFSQKPAVDLCKLIAELLPDPLDMTYLVNSGTEAIEASLKLSRRVTGRSEILAMHNCYHGNTMGSLSLMDFEERKAPFRPLVPGIGHIKFNCLLDLNRITTSTAAVILESIQGGAGFIVPDPRWWNALFVKCRSTGTLIILDEIQPGMGRTGSLFYFEKLGLVPDMVISGKGLGGGMPIGSLTASTELLKQFGEHPMLGHITTFGGNPVVAAAALATLKEVNQNLPSFDVMVKELRFRESLQNQHISEVRGTGLMLAVILKNDRFTSQIVNYCRDRGVLFFLLLFEKRAIRITPPLIVEDHEIDKACEILLEAICYFYN